MDFTNWLHKRLNGLPDADKLVQLIQAAGASGIPEGELRSAVDLPRQLVDNLLQALVGSRQVGVINRGGKRVYFSRF